MKHTTEEYLAWIDERIAKLDEVINNPCAWGIETEIEYRASLLANRDVLVMEGATYEDAYDEYESGKIEGFNKALALVESRILQRLDEVM